MLGKCVTCITFPTSGKSCCSTWAQILEKHYIAHYNENALSLRIRTRWSLCFCVCCVTAFGIKDCMCESAWQKNGAPSFRCLDLVHRPPCVWRQLFVDGFLALAEVERHWLFYSVLTFWKLCCVVLFQLMQGRSHCRDIYRLLCWGWRFLSTQWGRWRERIAIRSSLSFCHSVTALIC